MTAFSTEGQSDPTVQPVPAFVVEQVDAADITLSNPKRAVISLGSNLGNRLETLQGAIDALEDTPGLRVKAVSPVYETEPWGVDPGTQPSYFNAVVVVKTTLPPPPSWSAARPSKRPSTGSARSAGVRAPLTSTSWRTPMWSPTTPCSPSRTRGPASAPSSSPRGTTWIPPPNCPASARSPICSPVSAAAASCPGPTWNSGCPSSR